MTFDDDLLRSLAAATARELETFCAELELASPNERDHLAKCCKRATAGLADALDPPPALSPYAFGDPRGWVGLGTVDVVLRWTDREPIFLELKCGAGKQVLRGRVHVSAPGAYGAAAHSGARLPCSDAGSSRTAAAQTPGAIRSANRVAE